jgi:hypothetical protein
MSTYPVFIKLVYVPRLYVSSVEIFIRIVRHKGNERTLFLLLLLYRILQAEKKRVIYIIYFRSHDHVTQIFLLG